MSDVPRIPINGDAGPWSVSPLDYPHADVSQPVDPVEFVKAIQRQHGIAVDGVAGPQTWAVAIFGAQLTAADIKRIIGNPLTNRK